MCVYGALPVNLEVLKAIPVSNGRSTPILFVHGMWHAAWCWTEHFLPYFAEHGYISHALSLRGHGSSEGRERLRWASLADYVSDLEQAVNLMERPPVLVGHSMGGMVVQKYLELNEAPAAVLLASVPPKGVARTSMRVVRRHPLAFMKALLTLSMFPLVGTPRLAQEAFFSVDMPEERVSDYFSRLQDESLRVYLDMLILNLPRTGRVSTPLLVLGAADDGFVSPVETSAIARAYGTSAEIFPNIAHDMMLEAGWRMVADRILDWLNEQGV
jgi:hypothetical protein